MTTTTLETIEAEIRHAQEQMRSAETDAARARSRMAAAQQDVTDTRNDLESARTRLMHLMEQKAQARGITLPCGQKEAAR